MLYCPTETCGTKRKWLIPQNCRNKMKENLPASLKMISSCSPAKAMQTNWSITFLKHEYKRKRQRNYVFFNMSPMCKHFQSDSHTHTHTAVYHAVTLIDAECSFTVDPAHAESLLGVARSWTHRGGRWLINWPATLVPLLLTQSDGCRK